MFKSTQLYIDYRKLSCIYMKLRCYLCLFVVLLFKIIRNGIVFIYVGQRLCVLVYFNFFLNHHRDNYCIEWKLLSYWLYYIYMRINVQLRNKIIAAFNYICLQWVTNEFSQFAHVFGNIVPSCCLLIISNLIKTTL